MSFMAKCESCQRFSDCLLFTSNPSGITTEPKVRYTMCRICLGIAGDRMRRMALTASCKHCLEIANTIIATLDGRMPEGMFHIPIVPHSNACRLVRRVPIAAA